MGATYVDVTIRNPARRRYDPTYGAAGFRINLMIDVIMLSWIPGFDINNG